MFLPFRVYIEFGGLGAAAYDMRKVHDKGIVDEWAQLAMVGMRRDEIFFLFLYLLPLFLVRMHNPSSTMNQTGGVCWREFSS